MPEAFAEMLTAGGRTNSLGRTSEVIDLVLRDRARIDELYRCLFVDDAWVRMRAADALEKICREHPDWLLPFIDRFAADLHRSDQPSIQWHLAQIYAEVELSDAQRRTVIAWLEKRLSTTDVDWIVAANAMTTLARFAQAGLVPPGRVLELIGVQQDHRSKSVARRAAKLRAELESELGG